MSKNDRVFMPSSQGGIVRYFDEEESKLRIKPGYVIVFIVLVLIAEIVLQLI